MSVGVLAMCLMISALWLLIFFPASAVARLGPGASAAATETILYMERTPSVSNLAPVQVLPQRDVVERTEEVDTIFGFHRKFGDGGDDSVRRRGLVGSSPPTCRSKCGTCTPCKAVHVAIGSPHGVISETEYYPEVWRCQCGNRYYMP